ncbi:MAG TPA: thioredoxin family protein [Chitinophagaceae bacterium]|nr:thioredoxin family protein [Chitinophagaceae bacterium]MCB9055026.1 thioredoxin family protein [Chitinophagales bacterium]HRX92826.1 thioredoxin family protein [Chitinophagaceae bacterium]
MARTPSRMVELQTQAPPFTLPDTITGNNISYNDIKGAVATVVMFICNHCPFVVHVNSELVKLANDYKDKEVGFVAISANDVITHPDDGPEEMKRIARQLQYPFSYCYDESQETAKVYGAECTPDFFIYDKNNKLVYRGQLDDSRPGNDILVTGKDVRHALDCLINEEHIPGLQRPSIGCNIKWK